jgi:hypothetical protein
VLLALQEAVAVAVATVKVLVLSTLSVVEVAVAVVTVAVYLCLVQTKVTLPLLRELPTLVVVAVLAVVATT